MTELMSRDELEAALRAIGAERYHSLHPFHKKLHGGELNKGQVQAWALNRYCYQAAIPRKDAALMARTTCRELRREWIHRIQDHDGDGVEEEGGIERWLALTTGLGIDPEIVISTKQALPATVHAVEEYVEYVKRGPMVQAVASSLTELFAPKIHEERISGMLENYDFIDESVMKYFRRRLNQAPRDANFALKYVLEHADTIDLQQRALEALTFKCNVLWAQLDALYFAYVEPGLIPPGAFRPQEV